MRVIVQSRNFTGTFDRGKNQRRYLTLFFASFSCAPTIVTKQRREREVELTLPIAATVFFDGLIVRLNGGQIKKVG
jgi:hypothetical protein